MEHVSRADTDEIEVVEGVQLAQLATGEEMSVQHFRIDAGATVPAHSHPHEQSGFLSRGTLVFEVESEELVVAAGDSYVVPGGVEHGVENPGDEPASGVDIFSPPRPDPDWSE